METMDDRECFQVLDVIIRVVTIQQWHMAVVFEGAHHGQAQQASFSVSLIYVYVRCYGGVDASGSIASNSTSKRKFELESKKRKTTGTTGDKLGCEPRL